jgi:hypothetical protein
VLVLLAEGRTNWQIGQALFITEKTASVHFSRILAKLGSLVAGGCHDAHRPSFDKQRPRLGLGCYPSRARVRCHRSRRADRASQVLTSLATQLAATSVSPQSNALYDRCATETGVLEVGPMDSKRAGQKATQLLKW